MCYWTQTSVANVEDKVLVADIEWWEDIIAAVVFSKRGSIEIGFDDNFEMISLFEKTTNTSSDSTMIENVTNPRY